MLLYSLLCDFCDFVIFRFWEFDILLNLQKESSYLRDWKPKLCFFPYNGLSYLPKNSLSAFCIFPKKSPKTVDKSVKIV